MSNAAFVFGGSVGKVVHQPASLTARRLECHQCTHAPRQARFRGQDFKDLLNHRWFLFFITRIRRRCDFGGFTTCHSGCGVRAEQKDTLKMINSTNHLERGRTFLQLICFKSAVYKYPHVRPVIGTSRGQRKHSGPREMRRLRR